MDTVHSYVLSKNDGVIKLLEDQTSEGLFNVSLVIYDNGREFVVGNA